MSPKKIVIIGGVAGGMTCATRLRRLSEDAEIIVLERGGYVSFANCGLPYHIGGEIADRGKVIGQPPENLYANYRLDVRTLTEAIRIDREARQVVVRRVDTGAEESLSYDALLLSMGAAPLRPPIPGIDTPGIFSLRTITDMDRIMSWITDHDVKQVVVGGGGYIGLEVAEQLRQRGLQVVIAEAGPQVMAPLDPEMAAHLHAELASQRINLHLNDGLASFEAGEDGNVATVVLKSGTRLPAGLVVMGLGVRPETALAKAAGLELGERGGIRVDEHMRTSDPAIYAAGDVVEVRDRITGEWAVIPLAGPANRQGRIVADNIMGIPSTFAGTMGTAVLRLFDLVAACTGANEKALKRVGRDYKVLHLHPGSHAGYFPGARPIALKILFDPKDGKLLGVQAVGEDGVDKRIDVFATALAAGMTVDDIAELELAYAPPFGSAKDPVNIAGMAAQNIRAGLSDSVTWAELPKLVPAPFVLDVRNVDEIAGGTLPGATHIPLKELRDRLGEVPKDRDIVVYCATGQRSYNALRILKQKGYRVRNLSGAYKTWSAATK